MGEAFAERGEASGSSAFRSKAASCIRCPGGLLTLVWPLPFALSLRLVPCQDIKPQDEECHRREGLGATEKRGLG